MPDAINGATAPAAPATTAAAADPLVNPQTAGTDLVDRLNQGSDALAARAKKMENRDRLGKDDFMKLLVTSLKYQDPSSPMDTSQMMQQTTQLATMEQLNEMTKLTRDGFDIQQRAQAASLVGVNITYTKADDKGNYQKVYGIVESASYGGPQGPVLRVNGEEIALSTVVGINLLPNIPPTPPTPPPPTPPNDSEETGGATTDPAAPAVPPAPGAVTSSPLAPSAGTRLPLTSPTASLNPAATAV